MSIARRKKRIAPLLKRPTTVVDLSKLILYPPSIRFWSVSSLHFFKLLFCNYHIFSMYHAKNRKTTYKKYSFNSKTAAYELKTLMPLLKRPTAVVELRKTYLFSAAHSSNRFWSISSLRFCLLTD